MYICCILSIHKNQSDPCQYHPQPTQSWWRHLMETSSALLDICAGNSPVPGEFHAQRPVTRSFDVFFDLRLKKQSSKQSWGWWFETLSRPLWRHCNVSRISQLCTHESNGGNICQNICFSKFPYLLNHHDYLHHNASDAYCLPSGGSLVWINI